MSRLFGIVGARDVCLRFGLGELTQRLELLKQNNPDGWGLGWIGSEGCRTERRALPLHGSPETGEAWIEGQGGRFVGHIRRGTRGGRSQANTHPFLHEGWLFAHSGHLFPKLEASLRRKLGQVQLESETDSEALFRWLLKNREAGQGAEDWLRQSLEFLVADGEFSSLNFIMANQATFYAFRLCTRSETFYSLYYRRWPPGLALAADSEETYTRLESPGLAEADAVMVCSEKLLGASWTALQQGELLSVTPNLQVETFKLF